MEANTLDRVIHGEPVPELDGRDRALVRFARRAAADPRQLEDGDFRELESLGMGPEIIMEALSIVMMSAFTNTMAIALQLPLPEADQPEGD